MGGPSIPPSLLARVLLLQYRTGVSDEQAMERVALERTLELAEELGLLDGPVEQIIDSTPMLGAAATQDTVRLVRHGVRRLLDAVKALDARAAGQLDRS